MRCHLRFFLFHQLYGKTFIIVTICIIIHIHLPLPFDIDVCNNLSNATDDFLSLNQCTSNFIKAFYLQILTYYHPFQVSYILETTILVIALTS